MNVQRLRTWASAVRRHNDFKVQHTPVAYIYRENLVINPSPDRCAGLLEEKLNCLSTIKFLYSFRGAEYTDLESGPYLGINPPKGLLQAEFGRPVLTQAQSL